MNAKKHIFLSYSRKDLTFAKKLAQDLQNSGFIVWMDQDKITGGAIWRKKINDALENSHTLIWVVSPDSAASEYVESEVSFAESVKISIIPVIYKQVEKIPFPWNKLHFIELQNNYVQGFGELVKSIDVTATPKIKTDWFSWLNHSVQIISFILIIIVLVSIVYLYQNHFKSLQVDVPQQSSPTLLSAETVTCVPWNKPALFASNEHS